MLNILFRWIGKLSSKFTKIDHVIKLLWTDHFLCQFSILFLYLWRFIQIGNCHRLDRKSQIIVCCLLLSLQIIFDRNHIATGKSRVQRTQTKKARLRDDLVYVFDFILFFLLLTFYFQGTFISSERLKYSSAWVFEALTLKWKDYRIRKIEMEYY